MLSFSIYGMMTAAHQARQPHALALHLAHSAGQEWSWNWLWRSQQEAVLSAEATGNGLLRESRPCQRSKKAAPPDSGVSATHNIRF